MQQHTNYTTMQELCVIVDNNQKRIILNRVETPEAKQECWFQIMTSNGWILK
jgi:hypothetical protein